LDQAFSQWKQVQPEFRDHLLETRARAPRGVGWTHYKNSTGRNDLHAFKVAHDSQFIYFYAQTREPITSWQDPNWMMLLIDTDQDMNTGWQGCDFVVNRVVKSAAHTVLERHEDSWTWQPVAEISYRINGRHLHLALPREVLGLRSDQGTVQLDFKWIDNWQHCGDVMDMYLSGDTAPEGRFRFRYHGAGETRLFRKSPPSARERALFSPGKDDEAGDIGFIVDGAGCRQVEKGPLEARSTFPTEPFH